MITAYFQLISVEMQAVLDALHDTQKSFYNEENYVSVLLARGLWIQVFFVNE